MRKFDWVRGDQNDALYDIDGPVIVLTMEELKEVFEAGVKHCEGFETSNYNGRPDFNSYMASKGIEID